VTVVNSLTCVVYIDVDDMERQHASVRELKKKNLSLSHENARLEVMNCHCLHCLYCDELLRG